MCFLVAQAVPVAAGILGQAEIQEPQEIRAIREMLEQRAHPLVDLVKLLLEVPGGTLAPAAPAAPAGPVGLEGMGAVEVPEGVEARPHFLVAVQATYTVLTPHARGVLVEKPVLLEMVLGQGDVVITQRPHFHLVRLFQGEEAAQARVMTVQGHRLARMRERREAILAAGQEVWRLMGLKTEEPEQILAQAVEAAMVPEMSATFQQVAAEAVVETQEIRVVRAAQAAREIPVTQAIRVQQQILPQ